MTFYFCLKTFFFRTTKRPHISPTHKQHMTYQWSDRRIMASCFILKGLTLTHYLPENTSIRLTIDGQHVWKSGPRHSCPTSFSEKQNAIFGLYMGLNFKINFLAINLQESIIFNVGFWCETIPFPITLPTPPALPNLCLAQISCFCSLLTNFFKISPMPETHLGVS